MKEKDISCEVCGFAFRYSHRKRLHSHHMRPKEHGGDDTGANKILLCPNCHSIAHILLSDAIKMLFQEIDIYRLYERDFLALSILKYRRESVRQLLRRALKTFWHDIIIKVRLRWR